MKSQDELIKITNLLGTWLGKLRLDKSLSLFDSSKFSENIALKLLNEVFNLKLENLNHEYYNFPAIDLGDKASGVAFQITTHEGSRKISETLKKFIEYDLHYTYPKFKILVLNYNKPKYLTLYNSLYSNFLAEDLLDDRDIIKIIESLQISNPHKFFSILVLLENEFKITDNSLTNLGNHLFYFELINFFDYCNKQSDKFYQKLGEFSIIRIGEKLLEYQLDLRSSVSHMRMKLELLQLFVNPNNYYYIKLTEDIFNSYNNLINTFDEEFDSVKKVILSEVQSINTDEYINSFNKRDEIITKYYRIIKSDLSIYQNNVYKLFNNLRLFLTKNYDA